jgi:protein-S-isoprenylcysteine O-methyltransferase Ste14
VVSNVAWGSKKRLEIGRRAEVSPPSGREIPLILAVPTTFLPFIFCGLYVALGSFGLENLSSIGLLRIPQHDVVRESGVVFFVAGSVLFIWSVLARGRYSLR